MNLRVIRKKIKSVGNIKKITKAMQLVSAVKMKKAVQTALTANEFKNKLETAVKRVLKSSQDVSESYRSKNGDNTLIVLITTNKGLCGSLNINLLRKTQKDVVSKQKKEDISFITIGKKGGQYIASGKYNLLSDFSDGTPIDDAGAILEQILDEYSSGKYKSVLIAYNKFISSIKNEPTHEVLLPWSVDTTKKIENDVYLLEPEKEELSEELLKSYLEEVIRSAIINNVACEHSSRMIAMKNATDNATELIYELTLTRNQVRQEKITGELLDLTTAALSVN